MNFLLTAVKELGPYKEFIVLVCILLSILSLLVVAVKAYIKFCEKQKECEGKFNLQDFKIDGQNKKIDKIEKKTDAVAGEVFEMKPKVDDIHDWLDKYKKKVSLQDG